MKPETAKAAMITADAVEKQVALNKVGDYLCDRFASGSEFDTNLLLVARFLLR
jgi:hypothetical protein